MKVGMTPLMEDANESLAQNFRRCVDGINEAELEE